MLVLKCYPIAATQENWLHETIIGAIYEIHARLDRGDIVARNQETWRQLIPDDLAEDNRQKIISSKGIRDRVFEYIEEVEQLLPVVRPQVLGVMESQNRVSDLLLGGEEISSLEVSFPGVQEKVKKLFIFCFEKLTDFKVRERQYHIVFNGLDEKTCPFCGIERVMNPEETAQDQDHYLAKSIYPFSAANMRNLVPMCRCCNRDYKKAKDVLRCEQGNRRRAFDPYACESPPVVSLLNSWLDTDSNSPLPEWQVDFIPNSEEAETWDNVFDIRTRYKRDVLDQNFSRWLRDFSSKCRMDMRRGLISPDMNNDQVKERLKFYFEDKSEFPSIREGFLEPKIFEYLLTQFENGNERVVNLIRDAVLGVQLEDVA
ncbi:hypothetical protein [Zhongshania aquimaris]|uniref:HNH endonuclease n=1 Tax=Zhongshania aquimaris TaxID=2857107 RepID=A0ABS6VQC4_9GAMM|nr:hypothetical protein [Zhongshania aquimaris]MBW2940513.1 hypothetical protein [Zhongshania aquimaris]